MLAQASKLLPLSETCAPATQADLAAQVQACFSAGTPIYPLGGGTALHCAPIGKRQGCGIATTALNRLVDYPARDLTITVEAGMTVAALQQTLATENQFLPLDVPQAGDATVGGALAMNAAGPRRFGYGTIRDYVIGISAVDGRGTAFSAGGRVVKNVAGYDFCKLLVGSLGTLAVVTQVTFKVKPRPAAAAYLVHGLASLEQAESLAVAMAASQTTPVSVNLLMGAAWSEIAEFNLPGPPPAAYFVVGLEGTGAEVEWMLATLKNEWQTAGFPVSRTVGEPEACASLRQRLTEFGCDGGAGTAVKSKLPLVLKLTARPSSVVALVAEVRRLFPSASLLAHAGGGTVLARLDSELQAHELATPLLQVLHPLATRLGGQCTVWSSPFAGELTRSVCWGPARESDAMLKRVKQTFDPKGLLNPDRFIFG
ncbi:MAG: hypothetical protein C0483_15725 [Pirellula sp.]|nr:hypothetical protein [Pirellula sp.]